MEIGQPLSRSGRRQHYGVTFAALTVAALSYSLGQTMVVPALPVLQRDLHTSLGWATWLLTGYLLAASVAMPLLGRLGDQYGKERVLLLSLGLFLLGAVGAIFAWDIWALIGFRVLQGAGGAVFPLSFAIIKDEFPAEKVDVALGVVSAVFGIGAGFGFVVSGLVIDNLAWGYLFLVGAIPVAVSLLLVWRFVPESPVKTPSRLDLPGAAPLSGGLVALLLALTEAQRWGWGSPRILALFGAALTLLVVWGLVELRVAEPLVEMRMLARRPVLVTNLIALISGFAMFGAFVLVPEFVEMPRGLPPSLAPLVRYGFDASATRAGLYLLPGALLGFVFGPLAGLLGRRYGAKWPLALGMALTGAGASVLALWHAHSWQVVAGIVVALGGGLPLTFAAMAKLIVDAVRPSETGIATGMNTLLRTVGGVVGGQVGAAILAADTIGRTPLPAASAFVTAFWASALAALAAAALALFVTRCANPARSPSRSRLCPPRPTRRSTHEQAPGGRIGRGGGAGEPQRNRASLERQHVHPHLARACSRRARPVERGWPTGQERRAACPLTGAGRADDDPAFLEAVRAMLAADGRFELAAQAKDGQQAVRLASALDPDAVALDLEMPGLDGLGACRQIHASNRHCRIVICSGSSSEQQRRQALHAGAAAYVPKMQAALELADALAGERHERDRPRVHRKRPAA